MWITSVSPIGLPRISGHFGYLWDRLVLVLIFSGTIPFFGFGFAGGAVTAVGI